MNDRPSIIAWIALALAIILIFAVLIIYVIYFVNRDVVSEYGSKWKYINVSDTETEIRPSGHQVLSINGGSTSRGTNPDFIFIGKPNDVPYERRLFVIWNSSNSNTLDLRGDGINFECDTSGQFTINALAGNLFIWKNENTLIPIVIGNIPNN